MAAEATLIFNCSLRVWYLNFVATITSNILIGMQSVKERRFCPRMKDLFYDLSQQTIYYRFMKQMTRIPHKQIRDFVYVDHRNEVAIVGTMPEAHGEEIIAIGRYYLDQKTNKAEVAFTVKDQWQNRGVGTYLMNLLINIAKRNGISGFTAEVLRQNKAMQRVLHKSDCQVKSRMNEGIYSYELIFK